MAKASPKLEQFDRQLTLVVAPVLLAQGFTRGKPGREFIRPSPRGDDIHHLISFQIGPATSLLAGKYTIELGIYYPATARRMEQTILKPSIRHSNWNVRIRLGQLFADPDDVWWPQLVSEVDQVAQLKTIGGQLVDLGLPWFIATDSEENATRYNTGKKPKRLSHGG